MAPPNMNQPFDLFALFWTHGQSEKPIPGRLYRTADGIYIQAFEDLRPGPSYVPRHSEGQEPVYEVVQSPDIDKPLTIYGRIGRAGDLITADECILMRSVADGFGGRGEYIFSPRDVIFGAHTVGRQQEYSGVRIRTTDIDQWAGLHSFSFSKSEKGVNGITYTEREIESATLTNRAVLSLRQDVYGHCNSIHDGTMTRDVWLQIDKWPASTWMHLDTQIVTPLVSLITLCLGEVNKLTGVQLTIDGAEWLTLVSDHVQHAEPHDGVHEYLAKFPELGLANVALWLSKVDLLGPLPPVIAHFSAKQDVVKLETELLEMTTVAEGLHVRLFPSEKRLTDTQCAEVTKRALQAISDMDERITNILRGMLTHLDKPGYAPRLKGLAKAVEDVAPEICGNVSRWTEAVSKTRNSYAHRSAGFLEEGNVDGLTTVLESLRWLMRCILLLEAGLGRNILADRLGAISGYRLFLDRAAERLPAVYRQ